MKKTMLNWRGKTLFPDEEKCDVLIIGSGLAGLYCALQIDPGRHVIILSKHDEEICSSVKAQGGIAAAIDADDSPLIHFRDSMSAGASRCNEEALKCLVQEGPAHIQQLREWGVPFDHDAQGKLSLAREAAHSKRRIVHCHGDATGKHVTETLIQQTLNRQHIHIKHHWALADWIINDKQQVTGALTISTQDKKTFRVFSAEQFVLASGGYGGLFAKTTNHPSLTGDGLAASVRAGAEVGDLEFIQFHPTALYEPEVSGNCFLISEAVRGEGAVLRNHRGERFMRKAHQLADLAPRDVVARTIMIQMLDEQKPFVWLDATHLSHKEFAERFPTILEKCRQNGLNPAQDWLPVTPAQHYCMGGVKTDLNAKTSLENLLACGEAAWTGVYGANRLASNSLLECLVFGARAAKTANQFFHDQAQKKKQNLIYHNIHHRTKLSPTVPDRSSDDCFNRLHLSGMELEAIQKDLKDKMSLYCGVLRDRVEIERFRHDLQVLYNQTKTYMINDLATLEIINMIQNSLLIVNAILARKESVGAHYWHQHQPPEGDKNGIRNQFHSA